MGTIRDGIERVKKDSEIGELLEHIHNGWDTVKDLASVHGMTSHTMRYHLNRLRDEKLIKIRNEGSGGKTTYWQLTRDGRKALRRYKGEPDPEPGDSGRKEISVPVVAETAEAEMPMSRIDEIKAMLEEESQRLRVERLLALVAQVEKLMPIWAEDYEKVELRVVPAEDGHLLFNEIITLNY